ncbi:MAG: hypothetical protein KQH63_17370 [Desulfobulbaceae bacterium]|nr:hypothetical protein [Desulfobulbaceae bacterium]
MLKKFFVISGLLLVLLIPMTAYGVTVAVFPVEDLSRGRNGYNAPLTEFLRQNLADRGLEVISSEDLMAFMVRRRIRWLGFLDSSNIYEAYEDLGVDVVMLGTVSQLQEKPIPSLGMILTAVEVKNATTLWSESGGMSCADICNLLGLSEPEKIDDLLPVLANELLNSLPLDRLASIDKGTPPVEVEYTSLFPKHARPGEEIRCSVRLRPAAGQRDETQVQLMVGDNDYVTMNENAPSLYEATWVAPNRNESIPVSLVLQSSAGEKQVYYVGHYQVDDSAPKLTIEARGKKVNDSVAFSQKIYVYPQWQTPEPVSRWSFSIKNADGEIIANLTEKNALPKHFVWKGQKADGKKVDEGVYEFILKVWDRAGNETQAATKINFYKNPPVPLLTADITEQELVVTLDRGEGVVPTAFWSAKILFSDGETLVDQQGSELPVEFHLPLPADDETRDLEGLIEIQDILGNKILRRFSSIMQLVTTVEEIEDDAEQDEWVIEF